MFAHVARQAIYDQNLSVIGYELLFRNGSENCFPDVSPDEATSSMIASSHLSIGVEKLTNNSLAFINFHQDTLLYRFPSTLNPLNVVVEIVETVEVTEELIQACEHISKMGYAIALDDYDFSEKWDSLLHLAKYIKIEVDEIDHSQFHVIEKIKTFQEQGKHIVVERIEDQSTFKQLKDLGIDYFQGYFLSKPEMIAHKDIPVSVTAVVELVSISMKPEFDLQKVTELFESDVGLSYKLMRFVNNPMSPNTQKINSMSHALRYMGTIELKKFIALLALANLKGQKPLDLVVMSLSRAKFCKSISMALNKSQDPPNSFIMGLFSLIDALLDMPMEKLMSNLPFNTDIKNVLCAQGDPSDLEHEYRLCIAFEQTNWKEIDRLSRSINIPLSTLFKLHQEAIAWADSMKNSFD